MSAVGLAWASGTNVKGEPSMSRVIGLVNVDLPSGSLPFTRAELITVRERAQYDAKQPGIVEEWRRAFWALADAADRLDAMHARTVITFCEPDQPPKPG